MFLYNNNCLFRIAFLCLSFCLMIYIYIGHITKSYKESEKQYFINTEGCKMPKLNILNAEIESFLYKTTAIKCTNWTLFDAITIKQKNYLKLKHNKTEMQEYFQITNPADIICTYRAVKRKTDTNNTLSRHRIKFNLAEMQQNDLIEINQTKADIILVTCYSISQNKRINRDVHFFVKPLAKAKPFKNEREKLSIMIIGLDSVSHMNFMRQMQQTNRFLRDNFAHIEFWGYNKFERNTYPNLMPLLTGNTAKELYAYKRQLGDAAHYYDNYDLIWKYYQKAGYITSFAEDNVHMSLFNYMRPGFKQKPTDYYLRPVILELAKIWQIRYEERFCFGARDGNHILFDFFYKLLTQMEDNSASYFSLFWWTLGLHDDFNYPNILDIRFMELLEKLSSTNVLNRTLLFLMSDHGLRYGAFRKTYQGMLEDSQPLFILIYPLWFERLYAKAIQNLRHNTQRLITTFDMHATLKDLLNLENLHAANIGKRTKDLQQLPYIPRNISLFLPIPGNRTCEHIGITAHYCTCSSYEEIDNVYDARVYAAAQFAVKEINVMLQPYAICSSLKLESIFKAYMAPKILKSDKYVYNVRIRFQVVPNFAVFDATLQFDGAKQSLSGLSRVSAMEKQECLEEIMDPNIEILCDCV